jgi:hypothetical protein
MRRFSGNLRVALVWTLVMLGVAIVVALEALSNLVEAQQACFFNYPAITCPASDDPAVGRLTFAFIGVPLIWLVGIGIVGLTSMWQHRRGAKPR